MKKWTVITAALYLILSGCTKDLASLNNNPEAVTSAPAAALFLAGEKALADSYTSTNQGYSPFRVFAQAWTENTYNNEARYDLSNRGVNDGWWNEIYASILNNLEAAKKSFPKEVTDAPTLRNDLIVTDLLEIYSYNLLVTTFGNIPYTQAENRTIPFPKYDDAKTVYYDLLTRLDTCLAGLNTNAGAMGSVDAIYGGNMAAWKRLAASLKLKMAMQIADVDAATAQMKVQEAITTGVFQSNSDNALFAYDPSSPGNSNPIWQDLVNSGRHDFCPTNLLVNTMLGWNDPRLPLYFTLDPTGHYSGGIPGAGNNYGTNSDFSAQWLAPNRPADLLDYPETEFLLAEGAARGFAAGGTAATHYGNAIAASIQAWGGSLSDAANYLAQASVAYSTAPGSPNWRQVIGYQKWIAFADRNWDTWTEIRRLGYPNIDQVNPPVGAQGNLPLRFPYPAGETASNPVNCNAAIQAVNGSSADLASTKLWWMH